MRNRFPLYHSRIPFFLPIILASFFGFILALALLSHLFPVPLPLYWIIDLLQLLFPVAVVLLIVVLAVFIKEAISQGSTRRRFTSQQQPHYDPPMLQTGQEQPYYQPDQPYEQGYQAPPQAGQQPPYYQSDQLYEGYQPSTQTGSAQPYDQPMPQIGRE